MCVHVCVCEISHSTSCNEIAVEIRGVSEANRHGPMYASRVHGLLGVNCVSESGVPLITVRDLLLAVCQMVFLVDLPFSYHPLI